MKKKPAVATTPGMRKENRRKMALYRERKAQKGKCAYPGCWDDAVGLYCPGHSSSKTRGS